MKQDLTKKLINTWDWLNSYCLSKRDDKELACGQHAVCIVQIDNFAKIRASWDNEKLESVLKSMESIMEHYAMDDNLIARYNDSTFVVVLHYLESRSEIIEMCEEIKYAINEAKLGDDTPIKVSIGASVCRHDPTQGYKCAMHHALEALARAHKKEDSIVLSDAIK
ncbi:MAG: GGDEF domain-containing protein [Firmicutes bacterium]|nr:GGDEF domain-containing protein [Bacillota bacterium]